MPYLSLSKKGFDSTYGRGPSPILRDGRMVSLPIPEEKAIKPQTRYESLRLGKQTYASLLDRLGYSCAEQPFAHLDPDLVREVRPRCRGWRGMFGQVEK